jgi:hypothetical protein
MQHYGCRKSLAAQPPDRHMNKREVNGQCPAGYQIIKSNQLADIISKFVWSLQQRMTNLTSGYAQGLNYLL